MTNFRNTNIKTYSKYKFEFSSANMGLKKQITKTQI